MARARVYPPWEVETTENGFRERRSAVVVGADMPGGAAARVEFSYEVIATDTLASIRGKMRNALIAANAAAGHPAISAVLYDEMATAVL